MYNSRVPTRLAAAILIKHGEISLGEIRALPLVEDERSVLAIADLLAYNFPVTRFGRWEDGAPSSRFEDVIRLVEDNEHVSATESHSERPRSSGKAIVQGEWPLRQAWKQGSTRSSCRRPTTPSCAPPTRVAPDAPCR